ncbi:MAG: hypothetical protein KIG88_11745 [Weeksellaceae bacterium]|nr:hypothetical protein [Weeksellaceae bacterium]
MNENKFKLSPEEIEKNGGENNLRVIELPKDDNNTEFLEVTVKIPSRQVIGQYMKFQNVNPLKAQEILVKGCVLTNKDAVLADDALFFTTVSSLAELIPIREGRLKKF